jgi:hypothetical protein
VLGLDSRTSHKQAIADTNGGNGVKYRRYDSYSQGAFKTATES